MKAVNLPGWLAASAADRTEVQRRAAAARQSDAVPEGQASDAGLETPPGTMAVNVGSGVRNASQLGVL